MSKKTLYFMRHAKSDWSVSGQKDFDRSLNHRGLMDAPKMGHRLMSMEIKPDLILSSPALRAKMTAEYVSEQLKYEFDKIVWDEEIYEAPVRTLLSIINKLDPSYNNVLIFGHNPSITYLAEYLSKAEIGNIPTAGVVCIEFEVPEWAMVSEGTGSLKWFIYPKEATDI
jgi:phosphohistidine phosphatase